MKGSFTHTLEEFPFGDKLLTVRLNVSYAISAYDPGCHTMPNGDPGYPPEGGEVEDIGFTILSVSDNDDAAEWPGVQFPNVLAAVNAWYEADGEAINELCHEDAINGEPDYPD